MIRISRPHRRMASCPRCEDHGLVMLDSQVEDVRDPRGFRRVQMAYRCDCPAGERVAKGFALAPPRADDER